MRKIILFILSIIIVFLSIGVYFLINKSEEGMTKAEKEQAMIDILGRKPNLTDAPGGNIEYKGKFASFVYPKAAVIYTYKDPGMQENSSVLETFSFDTSNPKLVFNYSVFNKPDFSSVLDSPDVKLRQLKERGYEKADIQADGIIGLAFEKGGLEAEKSAFFFSGGKIYIVVVTGNNLKDVNKLFNQIIVSFQIIP